MTLDQNMKDLKGQKACYQMLRAHPNNGYFYMKHKCLKVKNYKEPERNEFMKRAEK